MDHTTIIILVFVIFTTLICMVMYRELIILNKRFTALETATIAILEIIADTSKMMGKYADEFRQKVEEEVKETKDRKGS